VPVNVNSVSSIDVEMGNPGTDLSSSAFAGSSGTAASIGSRLQFRTFKFLIRLLWDNVYHVPEALCEFLAFIVNAWRYSRYWF
jgi:hypothetical protein